MALDSINLADWIEDNRDSLKPPVGNKMLFGDGEFQVMIVAGPNTRRTTTANPARSCSTSSRATSRSSSSRMAAARRAHQGGRHVPAAGQHDPLAAAAGRTLGMVVERQRPEDEEETITWYCETCGNLLYQFKGVITDLGTQLKPVMENSGPRPELRTCKPAARSCRRPRRRGCECSCPSIGSTSTPTSCRRPGRTCGRVRVRRLAAAGVAGPAPARIVIDGRLFRDIDDDCWDPRCAWRTATGPASVSRSSRPCRSCSATTSRRPMRPSSRGC